MNIKKAYRLFISNVENAKNWKENLLKAAICLDIPVSLEKAMNPKNQKTLQRTKFWVTLKFRTELRLKEGVVNALKENGQLFVGREFFSEENKKIVTAISSDKFTVKGVDGRLCSNHNILLFPFNMNALPGEDFEGEDFWKESVK